MIDFTETIEPSKILCLLSRSVPYCLKSWHDLDETTGIFGSIDPASFNMRPIGSSSPVIEYVIRPHASILCILGSFIFLNEHDLIGGFISRGDLENKLLKGLRWACETHLTGTRDVETFLERKRWGENWRSSLWATLLGVCSILCRSVLTDELRMKVNNVVAFEADRFIDIAPPSGCSFDTKVEENAQDAMVLAWAINLWPEHPHSDKWKRTLKLWAVNIASSIHDRADHTAYLGSSLSRIVTTQNLFPDMTAENHGFFLPEILAYSAWVVLAAAAYTLQNRTPPEFLLRKSHQRTFDVLLRFCLPTGMIYSPGSQDFPLFMPRPMALAWGLKNNTPHARTLTARLLSWMDNSLTDGGENQGPWVFGLEQHHDGWNPALPEQRGTRTRTPRLPSVFQKQQ